MGYHKKVRSKVYIIDFGLTKRFMGKDNKHAALCNSFLCIVIVSLGDKKNFVGTRRYASINTHLGIEQSRRDDLEAIGHVIIYFLRGRLPWQGLKAKNKQLKYEKITKVKKNTKPEVLCEGLPIEFQTYIKYIRSLAYDAKPQYK